MAHIVDICCCRRLRPGRPLGHCFNHSKIPSCDTLIARCLGFKFEIYREGWGDRKWEYKMLDGILKGPGKLVLCCLMIARELPRGTHLPWFPTLCTDKLYKMWGGKWEWIPPGWRPWAFAKQHTYINFAVKPEQYIEICWESESWNERQKHTLNKNENTN